MSYKQAMKHWHNHRKQRYYQPIVCGNFEKGTIEMAQTQHFELDEQQVKLYAAAPDMLEALEDIEANLTGRDCFPERVAASIKTAQEAIKKARGEV
jgi:hypothetical protein